MSPGRLNADVDGYRRAGAANTPPPTVPSDPLAGGYTPIEQLLQVLGLAANLSDEQDNADIVTDHAERDLLTSEAAAAFENQDDAAAAELKGIAGQDVSAQAAQQIPQLAAGVAGSLAGALSGAMQQIGQIPQQLTQGAQQAMQAGIGMAQQSGGRYAALGSTDSGDAVGLLDELDPMADDLIDDASGLDGFGGGLSGPGVFGGGSAGGAGGGPTGSTSPAVPLGPVAPPSTGTFLSSARAGAVTTPAMPGHAPTMGGGMTGVPMVPPTAMTGAGPGDKDGGPDTKRISVPPVRNGAPVQGRIATPSVEPVAVRNVRGKPVATRRIMVDHDPQNADPAGRP